MIPVYQGEIVDTIDFEQVYQRAMARIVLLQNENYADKEAQALQTWLCDFLLCATRMVI